MHCTIFKVLFDIEDYEENESKMTLNNGSFQIKFSRNFELKIVSLLNFEFEKSVKFLKTIKNF